MKFFLLCLILSFHATPPILSSYTTRLSVTTINQKLYTETTVPNLVPSRKPPIFLAKVLIGEQLVPNLLYVDSGTSFTWIKCRACNTCQSELLPSYDPRASSTYKSVGCHDFPNVLVPVLSPVIRTGECHYFQDYLDGSHSKGTLAKETFQFETDDDGLHSVSDVVFGCASNITNGFDVGRGVLGLSYGNFSILRHFSNRFSFCFGTLNGDPYYGQGFLAFGEEARTTGRATPLIMRYGHYHVDLQVIDVSGRVIPVHLAPKKGNTIIDTGSSILYLAGESYNELESHINRLVSGNLNSFSHDGLVCYNGTIQREMSSLPTVTLTFDKGASLELDPTSIFFQYGDSFFCLAASRSPQDIDLNIIGSIGLQNYNIGFDLNDATIYFDKIACDFLD